MQRISIAARVGCTALLFALLAGCGGGGGLTPATTYTIGGTVSGLNGTLVLQNNGGNDLSLSTNGSFQFTSAIANGAAYNVTVKTQPGAQQCLVASGSGTVGTSNVTSVQITCKTLTFTVGGTLTGLGSGGSLDLKNNGSDTLHLSADGAFSFATAIASGSTFDVQITTQTAGQRCTITGGSGTVTNQNVQSIAVRCPLEQVLFEFSPVVTELRLPLPGLFVASDGNLYGVTAVGGASTGGALFKVTPGGTFSEIYKFGIGGVPEPSHPQTGPIEGSDGAFYGTSAQGGAFDKGTVYRVTPAGAVSTLYSFSGIADGGIPAAGIVQDSGGTFYGVTKSGGANGAGTAFKLSAAGVLTTLWDFASDDLPDGTLIQASDGNLYATLGGMNANVAGALIKLTPSGTFSKIWSFGAAGDGYGPTQTLVQAPDGHLYGTTSGGGAFGFGAVFRWTLAGVESLLYSFQGGTDGAYPSSGLTLGGDGYLYGTTSSGGTYSNGTAYRISTSGAKQILWDFGLNPVPGSGGAQTQGVVLAPNGALYGTTYGGGQYLSGTVFRVQL
jgi:uncharacterized repeat protein (TIGR03803 family)